AYYWLLTAESVGEPPRAVRKHLHRCSSCRHRQQQLLCLNQELQQLPRPGESPRARKRLFQQLERLPVPEREIRPPTIRPAHKHSWRVLGLVGAVAAGLLLTLGLGWS